MKIVRWGVRLFVVIAIGSFFGILLNLIYLNKFSVQSLMQRFFDTQFYNFFIIFIVIVAIFIFKKIQSKKDMGNQHS